MAGFDHAQILPVQLAFARLVRFESQHGPALYQQLHFRGAHRSITKQVLVVPDSSAEQGRVVEQALLPAAWIQIADLGDWNYDVNELKCNSQDRVGQFFCDLLPESDGLFGPQFWWGPPPPSMWAASSSADTSCAS